MTECARPTIGGFYRHFKNRLYQVLSIAVHADTGEELVIYQALYGEFRVYARPLRDFMSEVDHEKYPDAMQKMRFVKVTLKSVPKEEPAGPVKEGNGKLSVEEPKDQGEGSVHPLLLAFLDAESFEDRLKIFDEMEGIADMHMLDAVAASLDISLSGNASLQECFSLIRDNLVTQKKYECSRWR